MGTHRPLSPIESLRMGVDTLTDHPALTQTAVHDLMDTAAVGSPLWAVALAADDLRDALRSMHRALADLPDTQTGE